MLPEGTGPPVGDRSGRNERRDPGERVPFLEPELVSAQDGSLAALRDAKPRQGLREEESLLLRFLERLSRAD